MNNSKIIKTMIEDNNDVIFFASELYNELIYELTSENAYYKMLERMCNSNELIKLGKGTYAIPRQTKYGIVEPSDEEIIEKFLRKQSGAVIGYALYNQFNLSTQVPKNIMIYTNDLIYDSLNIKNIKLKRVNLKFDEETILIIQALDILQNFNYIEDLNLSSFKDFTILLKNNYNDKKFNNVVEKIKYKKSTLSFFKNVLDYYNVSSTIDKYLSKLSTYNHPRMEELYDIA